MHFSPRSPKFTGGRSGGGGTSEAPISLMATPLTEIGGSSPAKSVVFKFSPLEVSLNRRVLEYT